MGMKVAQTLTAACLVTVFMVWVEGCESLTATERGLDQETKPREVRYGQIELLRDRWGVPHVFAETDAGAMYGLGYASAQDRAFQMYYNLRIMQGRLAELIGDVKVGVTRRRPQGRNSAVQNDVKMRTIGYYRAAQKVAENLDAESLNLLQAYSEGVNDYVSTHPNDLLYLFERLRLEPEPWTPADCVASWWRLGLFFSGDGLREMVPYYEITDGQREVQVFAATNAEGAFAGRPLRDDASVIQRDDVSGEWVRRVTDYALEHDLTRKVDVTPIRRRPSAPRFSHAWVVGRGKTTDGSAVLVSDPQTPVRNPSLLYEFHIAGKTFNARGVGVAGSPIILIGFSQNVAWGMTALGADQADLLVLNTDRRHHLNQYLFDGRWLDMEVRTETVKIKGGWWRPLVLRETHLGPVVTSIATGVRHGDQVVLKRIPVCEPTRDTFQGALAMMRAGNVYQLQQALGGWRFPSANCVFGDHRGNIGYKTILALPIRSPHALLEDRAAHEGWSSDTDWQGTLPHELLPQMINPRQGWIVTANHRPIASFYPIPMGISTGGLGDTDRSWRLKEQVRAQRKFTPEDVLDIHYDMVNPIKRHVVRFGYHLRDIQKFRLEAETLKALEYLGSWRANGSKLDTSIKGTEIVTLMPMAFRQNFEAARTYGGGLSGLCNMLQTIDARLQDEPDAALTAEEAEYINLILRAAWRYGKANYGEDPDLWHEKAKEQLIQTKLGYFATLDGFGSLDEDKDITYPALTCLDGGTILSQKAQAYTQFVPLADADSALSLLPPGQSEHPDSPYHLSNYELWEKGQLHPAPLSREGVQRLTAGREVLQPD